MYNYNNLFSVYLFLKLNNLPYSLNMKYSYILEGGHYNRIAKCPVAEYIYMTNSTRTGTQ